MNIRRLIVPALVGLALIHPSGAAVAQQAGAVELGGFLQLDRLGEALQTKKLGGGAGGLLGIYFSPRWELSADGSYSQADPVPPRATKAQINYYVGRLNYNVPFGRTPGNAVILGAGVGADRVDGHSDVILSPALGLRTMLADAVALRFDLVGMFAPNPNSATYQFPTTTPGVNDGAARMFNGEARVGISFMFGMSKPKPVVVAPPPAPAPAPAPPPPPPFDSSAIKARIRQDSIDAANRRAAAERAAAERALADARALLNAPIYFDYDKSEIRADAKSVLDSKLALLRANPTMKIRIEGNTDSRGSNEYNMALGLRRANSARRYLVSQGIDEARFEVVSYGEERPVDQGTTEEAYQKNRRDDFVITVGGDNMTVPK